MPHDHFEGVQEQQEEEEVGWVVHLALLVTSKSNHQKQSHMKLRSSDPL